MTSNRRPIIRSNFVAWSASPLQERCLSSEDSSAGMVGRSRLHESVTSSPDESPCQREPKVDRMDSKCGNVTVNCVDRERCLQLLHPDVSLTLSVKDEQTTLVRCSRARVSLRRLGLSTDRR
jgi:hypothetical protein